MQPRTTVVEQAGSLALVPCSWNVETVDRYPVLSSGPWCSPVPVSFSEPDFTAPEPETTAVAGDDIDEAGRGADHTGTRKAPSELSPMGVRTMRPLASAR